MTHHKRWSKLKRDIESILIPEIKIYSNSYKNGTGQEIGRFWITLGKDIIWDFPKDYIDEVNCVYISSLFYQVSSFLRRYLNTSRENIFDISFFPLPPPRYLLNLLHILQISDKRVGKRKLKELLENEDYNDFQEIINKRFT